MAAVVFSLLDSNCRHNAFLCTKFPIGYANASVWSRSGGNIMSYTSYWNQMR